MDQGYSAVKRQNDALGGDYQNQYGGGQQAVANNRGTVAAIAQK